MISMMSGFAFTPIISKKNVDGRSTSSHDNKKFRTRPMEKERGMTFGFRTMATAVRKPDR